MEQKLAAIWSEILEIKPIGIHDNFFELGGHSLLATRIITRIRKTFSLELPLHSFFETPTIHHLASSLETLLTMTRSSGMPHDDPDENLKEGII